MKGCDGIYTAFVEGTYNPGDMMSAHALNCLL